MWEVQVYREGIRLGSRASAMPKGCGWGELLISWDEKGYVLL